MKITPIDIIKDMSGKVCSHSDTYVSLNSSSGKMFTGKRCHPYDGPASTKQLNQQAKFKTRSEQATAWLNANKEIKDSEGNITQQMTSAYKEALQLKKQMQLSNVRQVVCKYMAEDGTVTLPSGANGTSGSTSSGSGTGGQQNNPQTPASGKYTLTVSSSPDGQALFNVTSGTEYDAGTSVSLACTPQGNYVFDRWSDGDENMSRTIVMNGNKNLVAILHEDENPDR